MLNTEDGQPLHVLCSLALFFVTVDDVLDGSEQSQIAKLCGSSLSKIRTETIVESTKRVQHDMAIAFNGPITSLLILTTFLAAFCAVAVFRNDENRVSGNACEKDGVMAAAFPNAHVDADVSSGRKFPTELMNHGRPWQQPVAEVSRSAIVGTPKN
jgi:hypothetical protein